MTNSVYLLTLFNNRDFKMSDIAQKFIHCKLMRFVVLPHIRELLYKNERKQ